MTNRTKRNPLSIRAFATPKLHRRPNAGFLFVFFLEPLILFATLIVVKCYTFKLSLKIAYLRLKCRYLAFKVGCVINSKRQAFPEDVGDGQFNQSLTSSVNEAHDDFPLHRLFPNPYSPTFWDEPLVPQNAEFRRPGDRLPLPRA